MGKNVVVCYDGTANEYEKHNTNVVKLYSQLECDDRTQYAFYDPGVGTFNPFQPGSIRRWGRKIGIAVGNGFGWGLETNLRDGYRFLMNHFDEGDDLYIFGFSRGAYTARALAGMLYYFGLLEKGSDNLIPYVTKNYVERRLDLAHGFKQTFCRPCDPYFVGVWDTVKSLDYLGFEKFYDAELKENVKYGYQAVAIDEKRRKFQVNLWNESKLKAGQKIEQVWFPGVHSDIGGGYPETSLSDVSLGWMMDRASEKGLKLKKDWQKMLHQDPAGYMHQSYKGLWKLLGKVPRKIPEESIIHRSVRDRMEQNELYEPSLPQSYKVANNPVYPD